jgi:hypothetical protein
MDVEAIRALRQSLGWEELVKEIDRLIDSEIVKLKIATPDAVIGIQESIKAFEVIKNLPMNVIEREE